MTFEFFAFRFRFRAKDSIYFPPAKAANVVRGAFGTIFRKLACVAGCDDARRCELRATCPYARIFEPAALGEGPSGLGDWPRPFVFRAAQLDGRLAAPGDGFHFDTHLFYPEGSTLPYFVLAFAQLAREGLGPRRGRADLESVEALDLGGAARARVYEGETFLLRELPPPLAIDLTAGPAPVSRARVRFLTPTELKSGHQVVSRPEFGVLFARIRDRVSTLRALYGAGPLEIDFRGLGERAAAVRMARCEVGWKSAERRSAKTGQRHALGGFVGEAEYEGELGEFVPYLEAARWTGVGRQTVWGKGVIEVSG